MAPELISYALLHSVEGEAEIRPVQLQRVLAVGVVFEEQGRWVAELH